MAIVGRKRSQIIPYQVVFASRDIAFCAAEDLQVFLSKAFDNLKDLLLIKARASSPRVSSEVVDDLIKLCDHVKRYPLKKTDRQALRNFLATSRPRSLVDGLNTLLVYKGALKGTNDDGEMSEAFASAIRQFLGAGSVKATIRQISESLQGLQKDYGKAEEDIFYTDPPFIYLSEYADRYGDDFFGFIEDIEKAIATLAIVPSEEEASGSSDVWKQPLHLMTALRAKGKEFDAVFLLDVNDGIWPSKLAESDAQKEQERRVFYVAMTRARKRLVMLSNRTVLDRRAQPSPYLAEMGLVDSLRIRSDFVDCGDGTQ